MKMVSSVLKNWRVGVVAVVGLALTACSSSEEYKWEMWDNPEEEQAAVSVQSENGTAEDLKTGITIGIYVVGEDGEVTLVTATVDADGNIILPPEATTGNTIVYTPFQSDWGIEVFKGGAVFEVKTDQASQDGYDASDLMIGTALRAQTRAVEMEFSLKHMLAKVMIHVIDETGSIDGNETTMTLLGMLSAVNVNLATMSVSTIDNTQMDIDMLPYSVTDRRMTMTAIVAPQKKEAGDDLFEFNLQGAHRKCVLPTSAELEGGKTFVFQMRYTEEGLIPDGSYITGWEADDKVTDFNIRTKK